jgi:hypothetical protein
MTKTAELTFGRNPGRNPGTPTYRFIAHRAEWARLYAALNIDYRTAEFTAALQVLKMHRGQKSIIEHAHTACYAAS